MFEIDFEKACDSLKWGYFMINISFSYKEIRWIKKYISYTSTLLMINVYPTSEFFFGLTLEAL